MTRSTQPFPLLAGLLLATVLVSLFQVSYVVLRMPLSKPAELLSVWSMPVAICVWAYLDAWRRKQIPCHDFDLFIGIGGLVTVTCYLFWSRGWRGWLTLLALLGLLLLPWLIAEFLVMILVGAGVYS
jgi:hypothetical protein